MTNKELNMAILNKLYEIAEMIWQKMARNDHGCFRASEIAKNMGEIFYWGDADIDIDELIQIEVGSFRCEFNNYMNEHNEQGDYTEEKNGITYYYNGGGCLLAKYDNNEGYGVTY